MWKLKLIVGCIVFLVPVSIGVAHPLDGPDIVYIDGSPCNSACQSYMAWSRRVLSGKGSGPSMASTSTQPTKAQKTAKRNAGKSTNERGNRLRIANKPASHIAEPGNAKPGEKSDPVASVSSATSNPEPAPEAARSPTEGGTLAPAQSVDEAKPANSEAAGANDATTAALAPPKAEQLVAILLARSEIKAITDLANQTIAIDESDSKSIPAIKSAIATAGAGDVQLSEDKEQSLTRVMQGEVPAGVVLVGSSEEAARWTEVPGFNVLRLTLSPATPG